ncbi:MAG TPA: hypothetical protein PKI71_07465, partial [Candidatus Rifleibacterium sp.]|nr:hypothetical protein [Candidatus Rifleibacterium sp.]
INSLRASAQELIQSYQVAEESGAKAKSQDAGTPANAARPASVASAAADDARVSGLITDSSYDSVPNTVRHHLRLFRSFRLYGVPALQLVPQWPTSSLVLFWIFGWAKHAFDNAFGQILGNLSIFDRYAEFLRGIVDSGNVIFFVVFTLTWLFLATRVLESDRWR